MSETKTRPIIFSGPMVKAILEGRKSQTRRILKTQPSGNTVCVNPWMIEGEQEEDESERSLFIATDIEGASYQYACPYGKPGDPLWVRESGWQSEGRFFAYDATKGIARCSDDDKGYYIQVSPDEAESCDTSDWKLHGWKRTPSIHMPRWASRLTLRITDVRVERVQDISEGDAIAEGIAPNWVGDPAKFVPTEHGFLPHDTDDEGRVPGFEVYDDLFTARECYARLWDTINDKKPGCSWADNPWVWVVEFERVEEGKQ